MKSTRRYLIPGLILVGGLTTIGQNAAASTNPGPTLTIEVINSAQVGQRELIDAEKILARIYSNAGIEIRWTDDVQPSEGRKGNNAGEDPSDLSLVRLNILPQVLRELSVPETVMGLAPGSGQNRQWAYVFYDRVKMMAKTQIRARMTRDAMTSATPAQILAHAMAHEVGHLLLNFELHSAIGIMRGDWNFNDLRDISYGKLNFTSQQAAAIRVEVARRNSQYELVTAAKLDSSRSAQ
jgi:hypothetical protein